VQAFDDGQDFGPGDPIIDGCSIAPGLHKAIRTKPHELLRHRNLVDSKLVPEIGNGFFRTYQSAQDQKPLGMRQAAHQVSGLPGSRDHFSYIHYLEFIRFEC
jgi:hypothetical protein